MKKIRFTIKVKIICLILIIAFMPVFLGLLKIGIQDISNDALKETQADQAEALALLLGKFNDNYYDNTFLNEIVNLSDEEKEKIYSNPEEKLNTFIMYSINQLYSNDEADPESGEEDESVPYFVFPVDGHSYKHFPYFPTSAVSFVTGTGQIIIDTVYSNPNSTRIRILNSNYECIFDLFDYETHGNKTSDYFDIYSTSESFLDDYKLLEKMNTNSIVHFKKKIKAEISFTPDLYTAKSFSLDNKRFYILLNCKCSDELTYKERLFKRFTSILDIVLYDKPRVIVAILVILILMFSIVRPILKLATNTSKVLDLNGRVRITNLYGDKRQDEIGDLSRSFEKLITRLNSRIEENEEMTADLSHEIKNPLTAIRMITETVNNEELSFNEKNELCSKLLNETKRIELIINNIRQASKIENKAYENEKEKIKCDDYLENLENLYTARYPDKTIKEFLSAGNAFICISPELLDVVFDNLISNAVSFADEILISSNTNKDDISITVEDNGPGVPAEECSKIFNRFYSNRKNTDKMPHDGLGLHLVSYIIKSINGTIKVETSEKLGGAKFIIQIPIIKQEKNMKQ